MILTLIISIFLGTTILWMNPSNASLRWFSYAIFASGSEIFAYELEQHYLQISNLIVNGLVFLTDGATAFTFCMFGIVYSERFDKKTERRIMLLLLLMLFIVLLLTPLGPTRKINYAGNNEIPMVIYECICLLSSAFLLFCSYIREEHTFKYL